MSRHPVLTALHLVLGTISGVLWSSWPERHHVACALGRTLSGVLRATERWHGAVPPKLQTEAKLCETIATTDGSLQNETL